MSRQQRRAAERAAQKAAKKSTAVLRTPTGPALDEIDADVRRESFATYGNQIELLDELIIHKNQGTTILSGHDHDRGLNFIIGVLMARCFNSLWRAREDMVHGYYCEALTLARSIFESWVAALWIEANPAELPKLTWAFFREVPRPAPSERVPYAPEMLKSLRASSDLDKDAKKLLDEHYDMLSKFVHPRSVGLRWMIHADKDSTYFHAGGRFEDDDFKVCLFTLSALAQSCFPLVSRLQQRMLGDVDEGWVKRASDLTDRVSELHNELEERLLSIQEAIGSSTDDSDVEETPLAADRQS